jgi:hypothetical protein
MTAPTIRAAFAVLAGLTLLSGAARADDGERRRPEAWQGRWQEPGRWEDRDPVVVDRAELMDELVRVEALLRDALRSPGRKSLGRVQEARARLEAVRDALTEAPNLYRPPPSAWRPHRFVVVVPPPVAAHPPPPAIPAPPRPQAYPQQPPPAYPPPTGYPQQPPPPQAPAVQPMDQANFAGLVEALRRQPFDDGRFQVLRTAASGRWFLTAQVRQLAGRFAFAKGKLEAIRLLRPRVVDPENLWQLYDDFTFGSERAELQRILEQ